MDAAFTEEQDEYRRSLRALLRAQRQPDGPGAAAPATHGSGAVARASRGFDEDLWRLLARRHGLPGCPPPAGRDGAARDGAARDPVTPLLACEEAGRVLLPSPLLPTAVLAAPLIRALGSEAQRTELLPALAAGELTGALAVPGARLATALALTGPHTGEWAGGGRTGGIQARPEGHGGWRLYGEADQVLHGEGADVLVVAARAGAYARGRTLLFLVRAGAPGLRQTPSAALDETRPQARLELRDVPAALLGEDADGTAVPAALATVGAQAAVALAAEAVGAADALLTRTAAECFGRSGGGSPDIRQRLADLYAAVRAARATAYGAARAPGNGDGAPGEGVLALALALEALRTVAGEALQLHSGSSGEREAQHYMRRAVGDELLFGPAHRLRAHAAGLSGLFAECRTGEAVPA
ncbi:acyl-CoA dehydrogenase [Streptomyces sp. Ru73]|uniref:acyl-CoA dehydrogenase family protein n=1 Tax=Streptomyces sp. Ru73 TaxID=2080748 RepID=UPI000CDD43A4|nr:acyl-CoA dehydrogenase family protein [Streptomyces sp. Ru73]POX37149.1 acyl-CoA dehydrogenase [Streptomyces sp. Ru73]